MAQCGNVPMFRSIQFDTQKTRGDARGSRKERPLHSLEAEECN